MLAFKPVYMQRLSAEPVTIRWRVHGGPGSRSPIRSMSSLSTSSHAQGHGGGHHAHGQHGPDHGHSHGQHGSGCAAASHLTRAASTSPAAAALLASMGAAATAPPRMQQFLFAPIDAPGGMQLQLTVEYAATAQLHILQVGAKHLAHLAMHHRVWPHAEHASHLVHSRTLCQHACLLFCLMPCQ